MYREFQMGVTNHWTEVDCTGLDSQNKLINQRKQNSAYVQDEQLTTTDLTNGIGLV